MTEPRRAFQELMTDALDGRLSKTESDHFDAYLAESSEHRREWAAYREVRTTLLGMGTEAAPAGLLANLRAAIDQEGEASASPNSQFNAAGSLAAEPQVSSWSHFQRMGWLRTAAIFVVLIAVSSLLWEDGRRTKNSADSQVAESLDPVLDKRPEPEFRAELEEAEASEQAAEGHGDSPLKKNQQGWMAGSFDGAAAIQKLNIQDAELEAYGQTIGLQVDKQAPVPSEEAAFSGGGGGAGGGPGQSVDKNSVPAVNSTVFLRPARPAPALRTGLVKPADETLYHLVKTLPNFSEKELKSRGLNQLAKDADDRFTRVMETSSRRAQSDAVEELKGGRPESDRKVTLPSPNASGLLKEGVSPKAKAATVTDTKGKSFERPQRERLSERNAPTLPNKPRAAGSAADEEVSEMETQGLPAARPGGKVGENSKGARRGGKKLKGPPQRRPKSAKTDDAGGGKARGGKSKSAPQAGGATPPAATKTARPVPKHNPSKDQGVVNKTAQGRLERSRKADIATLSFASSRTSLPPAGGRTFYGVFGTQARTRLAGVLKGYPSAKPLAVQSFAGGASTATSGTAQAAPAYALWEIPMRPEQVAQLVGDLESTPGIRLRVLGRSLLKGVKVTLAPVPTPLAGPPAGRSSRMPPTPTGGRTTGPGGGGSATRGGISTPSGPGGKSPQASGLTAVTPATAHTVIIAIFDQ